MKRPGLKSDPVKQAAFLERGRKSSHESFGQKSPAPKRKRSGFAPASKAQREKVKASGSWLSLEQGGVRLSYGFADEAVDPMHLTPRSKGGCDHPDCVVAAARFSVHRLYDDGRLDLLAFFAEPSIREAYLPELQHMLTHLGPVEMVETLANDRVEWRGSSGSGGEIPYDEGV